MDERRVRPRPRVGLHAHPVDEAPTIEENLLELKISGTLDSGEPWEAKVFLPHPFTFLMMKLFALHDRIDDKEKDYGRYHALDLYAIEQGAFRENERIMRFFIRQQAALADFRGNRVNDAMPNRNEVHRLDFPFRGERTQRGLRGGSQVVFVGEFAEPGQFERDGKVRILLGSTPRISINSDTGPRASARASKSATATSPTSRKTSCAGYRPKATVSR